MISNRTSKPVKTIPKVTATNQFITLDKKEFGESIKKSLLLLLTILVDQQFVNFLKIRRQRLFVNSY